MNISKDSLIVYKPIFKCATCADSHSITGPKMMMIMTVQVVLSS
jgi:hypothetical protein